MSQELQLLDPVATHLFTFAIGMTVGAYINHRFSLARDRRKEFLEVARRLRPVFARHARSATVTDDFDSTDIEVLRCRMPWWRRRGFSADLARYKQAQKENQHREPAYGSVVIRNPEVLTALAQKLVPYADLRP